jgi:hypothetical protein
MNVTLGGRGAQETACAKGGCGCASVQGGEEEKADSYRKAQGDPAEGEAHSELKNGGEDGEGRLRAAHELFGDNGHE